MEREVTRHSVRPASAPSPGGNDTAGGSRPRAGPPRVAPRPTRPKFALMCADNTVRAESLLENRGKYKQVKFEGVGTPNKSLDFK